MFNVTHPVVNLLPQVTVITVCVLVAVVVEKPVDNILRVNKDGVEPTAVDFEKHL